MLEDITFWILITAWILLAVWLIRTHITGPVSSPEATDHRPCLLPFFDYKGVIHCHTVYSDGAVTFAELIHDANQLALDYVITSDHNTIKPALDGWEGWHNKTLILTGEEVSVKAGHLLVLNLGEKMPVSDNQAAINYANKHGALSFLAHPHNLKHSWTDWKVADYTGLEVINFDSICRRKAIQLTGIFSLIRFLRSPRHLEQLVFNNRPDRELKTWDALARNRKVVGIGGTDAHGFLKVGRKKYRAPRYSQLLQTVYTHLLTPTQFSGALAQDRQLVYKALANGNTFFSFDLIAPADGFQFIAFRKSETVIMGDHIHVAQDNPVTLAATLPPGHTGIIVLLRNGKIAARVAGNTLQFTTNLAGAYRIEVYHYQAKLPFGFYYKTKLWIGSNPIYVLNQ